jgi:hypothetical protein
MNGTIAADTTYQIRDRIGTVIELIPHLSAAANLRPTNQRGFIMHWRTAGKVKP